MSNIRVALLPGNAQTHSAGVYVTVNSHSLDAHLLARLDHLIETRKIPHSRTYQHSQSPISCSIKSTEIWIIYRWCHYLYWKSWILDVYPTTTAPVLLHNIRQLVKVQSFLLQQWAGLWAAAALCFILRWTVWHVHAWNTFIVTMT